jgi:chemotaxis protein MotB
MTSKDEEQALLSAATLLRKKFESRPEFSSYKDQIQVEVNEEGLRIQIVDKADRVSFNSGSAALAPLAQAVLEEIARGICDLPNPIKIGGHTDRHLFPPGSTYTNWELSADRANAARRELEANCVRPEQIRHIIGYADTQPLVPEDPYATANRRISITVMRQQSPAAREGKSGGEKEKEQGEPDSSDEGPKRIALPPEKRTKEMEHFSPAQAKLAATGAVEVGSPDRPPAGVRRARERKVTFSVEREK